MDTRLALLKEAEDSYFVTATYLVDLTQRAYELFRSSEVEERRQLIKLVLSNLRIEGKKVLYEAQKPFDMLLDFSDRQAWLEKWSQFRTTDWTTELEYPEYTAKEIHRFLQA